MTNNNIFKSGVKIFRPNEITKLIATIPKVDYKDKFEALLFTGMRYDEIRWLYNHKEAFTGETIHLYSKKKKAIQKERYVRLNNHGKRAVDHFLRSKKNLPHRDGWNANLRRWCKQAGIDTEGVCSKSTRKTWESWLTMMYKDQYPFIFLSQGHSDKVSIDYYLMLDFNDQDKQDMKFYTDGWI
jgi:integrase